MEKESDAELLPDRGEGPVEETFRKEDRTREIRELPITELDSFPDHPYRVVEDNDMQQLTDSVRELGVITPLLVHQKEDGRYEIISGHRRKYACEKLGYDTVRCEVIEVTRDEAIILMVDSNAQRSEICPCDKGRAYKMKLEAMSRQGQRTDLTSTPVGPKLESRSNEQLANEVGDSHTQIQRYIRLTYLTNELQEYVDLGQMKMRPAVELSYCSEDTQRDVVDRILETEVFPSHDQAIRIRKADEQGNASYDLIREIMEEEKPNQKPKFKIQYERIEPLLPRGLTLSQQEDFVVKALEMYIRILRKQRENSR